MTRPGVSATQVVARDASVRLFPPALASSALELFGPRSNGKGHSGLCATHLTRFEIHKGLNVGAFQDSLRLARTLLAELRNNEGRRMGTHADPDISVLEDLIQAYLQDHPRAADTALGVVEWWLPKDGAATVEQVEAALDHLVLEGIVDRREASDGGSLYRLRVRRH